MEKRAPKTSTQSSLKPTITRVWERRKKLFVLLAKNWKTFLPFMFFVPRIWGFFFRKGRILRNETESVCLLNYKPYISAQTTKNIKSNFHNGPPAAENLGLHCISSQLFFRRKKTSWEMVRVCSNALKKGEKWCFVCCFFVPVFLSMINIFKLCTIFLFFFVEKKSIKNNPQLSFLLLLTKKSYFCYRNG